MKKYELVDRAASVFGGLDEAWAWMDRPAIGLDQQRPVELMKSARGREAVADYLTRIEYGVYT